MSTRRKSGGRAPVALRHRRQRALAPPLGGRIAALARVLGARAPDERFGLDAARLQVVAALGDGAARSPAAAAARGGLDRVEASRALQALVRERYVERTYDAFDARRTLFRLTARGRALYRRVASRTRARERALLAALTPAERRQLDRLLAKLERAAASADRGDESRD
jgi:DNA-binding MarR family transcriptional regulator